MAYSVIIADPAAEGLSAAVDYIASELGAPSAAGALLDSFEEKLLLLRDNPKLFGVDFAVSEAVGRQIRRFGVSGYLAFYTVDDAEGHVAVVAFCHGSRDTVRVVSQARGFSF